MKTRLLQAWRMAVAALVVPLLVSCVEDSKADAPKSPAPTNQLAAAEPAGATAADEGNLAAFPEEAQPPEYVEPAPGSEYRPLPSNLELSPAATEITKMTHAGVNETVMLAFVTNSTGTFNLGSDQIVYLNDLGVASEIIAAMIEHDRLLREGQGILPPLAVAAAPAPQAIEADPAAMAAAAAPQALPQPTESASAPPPAATTEPVPAPPASVTYNYFYDSLSPYGTWVDVEGYGYCWQPSVVVMNPGWRPYCHGGRWIYSDYGWYWHSDYSWGWAPFHYGRWFTHPRWGWCWYPDTVWGPSWVSWRYTDAYCGWAPLPPAAYYTSGFGFTYYGSSVGVSFGFGLGWGCYSYVPWTHFHGRHYDRHCAKPHHARDIHRRSTVVNDFREGRHNRIVNHGIGEERVRQYTRTELRPVRVREEVLTSRDPRLGPGDRLERGGRELVIRRPPLPENPADSKLTRNVPRDTRAISTASVNGRRSNSDPRNSGGQTSPGTFRGSSDGAPPGRPDAQLGGLTQRDPRTPAAARMTAPRTHERSAIPSSTDLARQVPSPGNVTTPGTPSAQSRSGPVAVPRTEVPSSPLTTIGRRDAAPAPATDTPRSRVIARYPEPSSRANPTTTWTRPTEDRSSPAMNNTRTTTTPTQPTPRTLTPRVQRPSAPITPSTSAPQFTPRIQIAPTPPTRSAPQMSAPPPPAQRSSTIRIPSTPSYSAPPRPSPTPSYTPRAMPTRPPVAAPAPRPSPAPRYSAPSHPAPSFTPAPAAPRSAPSPPPSSSGRSSGGPSRPDRR